MRNDRGFNEDFSKNKKPREIKIEKNFENSGRFKIPVPVRISSLSDDKTYTESKYTLHASSKTNKLATLNDFRSKNFSSSQLAGSKNYAQVGSNWMSDPSATPRLSNEKVKVELTKEYFSNQIFAVNCAENKANDVNMRGLCGTLIL